MNLSFVILIIAICVMIILIKCTVKLLFLLEDRKKDLYRAEITNQLLRKWVGGLSDDNGLARLLSSSGIKRIAIYGMGYMGELLYEDLRNTSVDVIYGIDSNYASIYSTLPLYGRIQEMEIDAIIITPIDAYDSISEQIKGVCSVPCYSLTELVYKL